MDLYTMRTNLRRDLKDESPLTETPTSIDTCDSLWSAAPNVNCSWDFSDKKQGTGSAHIQIGAAHTTGLAAWHDRVSIDLSDKDYLRFWIKSSVALDAGDYQIYLDDTGSCASPLKSLDIPACNVDIWHEFQVSLGDASGLMAIISVGLGVVVDKGAVNIRLDDIRGIKGSYKWSNDELERHIARAVKDLSYYVPDEASSEISTMDDSREIDISSLTERIKVFAIEYPVGEYPPRYQRFSLWQDSVTLLGDEVPDGSNCKVYYGKLHTLDSGGSTVPVHLEDLLTQGAQGYALQAYAAYSVDRMEEGYRYAQERAAEDARELLNDFRRQLKKLGRFGRARSTQFYTPATSSVSKSTDWGP